MPGPSGTTRRPAVAGLFYPADPGQCSAAARQFVRSDSAKASGRIWRGAIVPHAGWVCSGAIAGEAIAALKEARHAARLSSPKSAGASPPDVVVVFGAVHTPLPLTRAVLASQENWAVPGGVSHVPRELSGRLESDVSDLFGVDDRFHEREHAVEVELPLIQQAWPNALLLPVEVPLVDDAVAIGVATAKAIEAAGVDAVYLASSDLTHYGPNYGFTPVGVGQAALAWAKDNDRKLLDCIAAMSPERVVPEVRAHLNACGGGAIAAMLAATRERGIVEARVLRHATSFETLAEVAPQRPDNAVGYAAVVVG